MPEMQIAYRGATVKFEAEFLDENDEPATTPSAGLKINYVASGERITETVAMAFNIFTNKWYYNWDSVVASAPCTVTWSLSSDPATTPVYVKDGCFDLKADAANLNQ